MKKLFSVIVVLFLSVFLVSGCGKKSTSSQDTDNVEHNKKPTSSTPVSTSTFSPYFYKSDDKGFAVVLTNSAYASWIQLSPTENNRVYVELFLEEKGTFKLVYYELQAGVSDSTILNEQTLKGDWKLAGDKISLSDIATLSKKTTNGTTVLTIGFTKDINTAGLKNKQTTLVPETRVFTALE